MKIDLLTNLLTYKVGVVSLRCNRNLSDVKFRNFKVKFFKRGKKLTDNEVNISNADGLIRLWVDLDQIVYKEGRFTISFEYKEEGMEYKTYKTKINYEPFSLPDKEKKKGGKKKWLN